MNWRNLFGGGRTGMPRVGAPPTTSAPLYQEKFESGLARAEASLGSGDYSGASKILWTLRNLTREAPLGVSGQYAAELKRLSNLAEVQNGNEVYRLSMERADRAKVRGNFGEAFRMLIEARSAAFAARKGEEEMGRLELLIEDARVRNDLSNLMESIGHKRYGYPTRELDEIETYAKSQGVDVSAEISKARGPVLRAELVIARRQLDELRGGEIPDHDVSKTVYETLKNLENARAYSSRVSGFEMPREYEDLLKEAHEIGAAHYVTEARKNWVDGSVDMATFCFRRAKEHAEKAGVSLPADLDSITAAAPIGKKSS